MGGDLAPKLAGGREATARRRAITCCSRRCCCFPPRRSCRRRASRAGEAGRETRRAFRPVPGWSRPGWCSSSCRPSWPTTPCRSTARWPGWPASPSPGRSAAGAAGRRRPVALASASVAACRRPVAARLYGDARPAWRSLCWRARSPSPPAWRARRVLSSADGARPALAAAGVLGIAAHAVAVAGLAPALEPLWLSRAVGRGARPRRPQPARRPDARPGHAWSATPSPAWSSLSATDTELGDADDAADAIAEGRPAVVEQRRRRRLPAPPWRPTSSRPRRSASVAGLDYSDGAARQC